MIEIDRDLLLGRGLHREVYPHPADPHLCMKVRVSGGEEEERRELTYYRLLQRRGVSWDMLPRYYGNIATDLGMAAIFDLIRDYDGGVSRTLEYYLAAGPAVMGPEQIAASLVALRDYLERYNIITMNIRPKNLLMQRLSLAASRCVVVDNIGNTDFIPLASYLRALGRRKIRRKWQRFKSELVNEFPDNPAATQVARAI